jgi:hypothetical protein
MLDHQNQVGRPLSVEIETSPARATCWLCCSRCGRKEGVTEGAVWADEMTPYDDRPPNPDELPALIREVEYELIMLRFAGWWAAQRPRFADAGFPEYELDLLQNACIETVLIHLRNLTTFFVSEPRKDDVVAGHYVPGWTRADGGDALRWLAEMATSLNKRVAHLTAYRVRVSKEDDGRLVEDICNKIGEVWIKWEARLTAEQRAWMISANHS